MLAEAEYAQCSQIAEQRNIKAILRIEEKEKAPSEKKNRF